MIRGSPHEEEHVDVRIGVIDSPRELDIAVAEGTDPGALRKEIEKALSSGDMLWLTDRRGRQVGVPIEKLAYVEIGPRDSERRVGFGG